MANESTTKTFTVAALLAIVCAIIVSLANVSLKDLQRQNQTLSLSGHDNPPHRLFDSL